MKKLVLCFGVLLLGGSILSLNAQTTAVTVTVVDSDSTVWANAPWSLNFQVGPNQSNPAAYTIGDVVLDQTITSQSGTANGSGVITFTVYRSTSVSPIGSSWNLKICPNASAQCSSFNFSTSGATLNLSSQVNAGILAPRFQAVSGSYGYTDAEAILQLKPGSTYWNVTSNISRCYTGSAWGICSTGGGSGVVSSSIAGKFAAYGATGTTIIGVTPYSPFVTDAPYLAKCDSSTDDTAAIQAAMDANVSISLPISTNANLQQCNITHLIQHNRNLAIYLNGSILNGTASSGTMLSTDVSAVNFPQLQLIGGYFDLSSTTGTPVELDVSNYASVSSLNFSDNGSGPSGYKAIINPTSAFGFFTFTDIFAAGSIDLNHTFNVTITGQFPEIDLTSVKTALVMSSEALTLTGAPTSGLVCSNTACGTYGTWTAH